METAENVGQIIRKTFDQSFLDEAVCRETILRFLHPAGPFCPRCYQCVSGSTASSRFYSGGVLRCPNCQSKFSGRSGTILSRIKLTYTETVSFCLLMAMGLPVKEIACRLGLRIRTAYAYQERFSKEIDWS